MAAVSSESSSLLPFRTPKAKNKAAAAKKHSLKPQIFLQLELSSPKAKSIDPSKVGVLNSDWRDDPSNSSDGASDHFVTHVRVEHCNKLPDEREIRYERPHDDPDDDDDDEHHEGDEDAATTPPMVLPDLEDPSSSEPQYEGEEDSTPFELLASSNSSKKSDDNEPPGISPSPKSVRGLGRHDHLLEPLPHELFQSRDDFVPQKLSSWSTALPSSSSGDDNHELLETAPTTMTLREDPPLPKSTTTIVAAKVVRRISDNGEEVADVRGSSLDLFEMVDMEEDDVIPEQEETKEKTTTSSSKPKRRNSASKRCHLRKTHSLSVLEDPTTAEGTKDPNNAAPTTSRKGHRRRSVGTEITGGGLSTRSKHGSTTTTTTKKSSTSSRKSTTTSTGGGPAGAPRRRRSDVGSSSKDKQGLRSSEHMESNSEEFQTDAPLRTKSRTVPRKRQSDPSRRKSTTPAIAAQKFGDSSPSSKDRGSSLTSSSDHHKSRVEGTQDAAARRRSSRNH